RSDTARLRAGARVHGRPGRLVGDARGRRRRARGVPGRQGGGRDSRYVRRHRPGRRGRGRPRWRVRPGTRVRRPRVDLCGPRSVCGHQGRPGAPGAEPMSPEDVPTEWVEKAARAIVDELGACAMCGESGPARCVYCKDDAETHARAALAAVLPEAMSEALEEELGSLATTVREDLDYQRRLEAQIQRVREFIDEAPTGTTSRTTRSATCSPPPSPCWSGISTRLALRNLALT